ncbi:hypothetical protein V8F06_002025 [Rhypophila decipiens]
MLLRNNSSSGEADQDIYLNMTSSASHSPDNNDLDAVTTHALEQSTTTSIYHTGYEMSTSPGMNDDVWGDDDDDTPFHQPAELTSGSEQPLHLRTQPESGSGFVSVSDIPRLKQEHTTAGYRDGVTIAKAASVQAGFDEGYGLGATIGAHAGRLLGLLQGLVGALSSNSNPASGSGSGKDGEDPENESARLQALLETATKELNVLSIFGEEYFARDGIWKYEVSKVPPKKDEGKNGAAVAEKTAAASTREASNKEQTPQPQEITETGSKDEGEKEEEETVVFADIAASHPLLKKWDGVLQQEAERYGLVWDVLLPEEDHHHEEDIREDAGQPASAEKEKDKGGKKPAPVMQNKGALAW